MYSKNKKKSLFSLSFVKKKKQKRAMEFPGVRTRICTGIKDFFIKVI